MAAYAENTQVPIGRSRDEIEHLVEKYGAQQVAFYSSNDQAAVMFVKDGRQVRFVLNLPAKDDPDVLLTPGNRPRTPADQLKRQQQLTRARWRALALVVKAKFEAVATGIVTYEQEFGMHMVMPDGRTVGEHVIPNIEHAVTSRNPQLLIGGGQR